MTYFLMRQRFEDGYERWLIDFEDGDRPCWLPLFWRDKHGHRGNDLLRWIGDDDGEYGFGELELDPRIEARLEEYRTDRIVEEKRFRQAREADDRKLERKKTESSVKTKPVQRPSAFKAGAREQLGFDFETGRPVYGVVLP